MTTVLLPAPQPPPEPSAVASDGGPAVAARTETASDATFTWEAEPPLTEAPEYVTITVAEVQDPDGSLRNAHFADGSEIVYGVPIADNGLQKLMRRVIILAAIGASFDISNFIVNLMRGSFTSEPNDRDVTALWAALSTLFIELSIPACGYSGALYNNRQLTCCFCSCNLFIVFISIMSFVRLHIRINEIDGQCEREENPTQRRSCEVWTAGGMDKYIMLVSRILLVSIGCLAFWFGNSLYSRLAQDFSLFMPSAPTPVVGEVIALTPATSSSTPATSSGNQTSTTSTPASAGNPLQSASPTVATGASREASPSALEEGDARTPSVASPSSFLSGAVVAAEAPEAVPGAAPGGAVAPVASPVPPSIGPPPPPQDRRARPRQLLARHISQPQSHSGDVSLVATP